MFKITSGVHTLKNFIFRKNFVLKFGQFIFNKTFCYLYFLGNIVDDNGQILTSEVNDAGEPVGADGYLQDNERARMASGMHIGLCVCKMRSPMSKRNRGFCQDDEDVKEQSGLHVDNAE